MCVRMYQVVRNTSSLDGKDVEEVHVDNSDFSKTLSPTFLKKSSNIDINESCVLNQIYTLLVYLDSPNIFFSLL